MSEATFKAPGGKDPQRFILDLAGKAKPTEGDAMYAAQRQRTRILERTARGVDVDEQPFAEYSKNGPYYYYPNGRVGNKKFAQEKNNAAAKRLQKKLGKGKVTPNGIRFESYADFKASLGRTGVDLRGPSAPHMLQAIAVKTNNRNVGAYGDDNVGLNEKATEVDEVTIGIYGKEAERASGHNQGIPGRLPKRRFFGASKSDIAEMVSDMKTRILARIKAAMS
jgi:hypothetical protein